MYRVISLFVVLILFGFACSEQASAQRPRRCTPGSNERVEIVFTVDGDINFIPCTGRNVLLRGNPFSGGGGGGTFSGEATSVAGLSALPATATPGQVRFRTSDNRFFAATAANQWSQFLTANDTLATGNGGTGQTTYSKGDLLVAQSATQLAKLPVGSNGQVLSANSATATGLSWSTPAAGGGGGGGTSVVPSLSTAWIKDEFGVVSADVGGSIGELSWVRFSVNGAGTVTGKASEPNRVGIATIATAAAADAMVLLTNDDQLGARLRIVDLTGGSLEIHFRLNQATGQRLFIGLRNQLSSTTAPTDGCYLSADALGTPGNFFVKCRNGNAETATDLGVTTDTNWHKIKLSFVSATQVSFQLDAGSPVAISTNVSTANLAPFLGIVSLGGDSVSLDLDAYLLQVPVTR